MALWVLRGVLLSGRIATGLAMRAPGGPRLSSKRASTAGGEEESGVRLITAGELEGAIEVVAEPRHVQFGDIVKRLPKMTYLALNVQSCLDLVGKKLDGMSDAYVTAVWGGTSQQTRVIRGTRTPQFDETLYFPTNLVRNTASELEAKGDLVLYVLHKHSNGAAPEDIGFARVPLHRVTEAKVARIDDGGNTIKSRVYEETLRLQQQGLRRADAGRGEVRIRAYFTPDLNGDVFLTKRENEAHQLESVYEAREAEWKDEIPTRLRATGRYLCKALDETNTMRFLPTYLCKCAPPRDVHDPMTIARMVHSISFQIDAHLTGRKGGASSKQGAGGLGGGEELWSSPNYFLDVKKGASEDHAILQCNLFLGLGIDAYLALGRLPGGIQQHVWVMTREPNGDVKFWETTKGDFYTLPGRWQGLYLDGTLDIGQNPDAANGAANGAAGGAPGGAPAGKRKSARESKYGPMDGVMDKRKLRAAQALAQDKAVREAERKAAEAAAAQKREEKLLYLASEEQWTSEFEINPFDTPRDFMEMGGHRGMYGAPGFGDEAYDEGLDEAGYAQGGWLNPMPGHKLSMLKSSIQDVAAGVRAVNAMRTHTTKEHP